MSFSNYLENELLDHFLMQGDYTSPSNVYVALSTTDPTEDGTGITEPADGYSRVSTGAADWEAAASGSISNANDITFSEATGSWGDISHFALFDASTGGNMLAYSALNSTKTVSSGDTPVFSAGDLTVSLD